jgi:hypothetical protein
MVREGSGKTLRELQEFITAARGSLKADKTEMVEGTTRVKVRPEGDGSLWLLLTTNEERFPPFADEGLKK